MTLALRGIFTSSVSEFAVFKGGTALAKCVTFINRFSDDIDMVVLRDPSLSANQRLEAISNLAAEALPGIQEAGITPLDKHAWRDGSELCDDQHFESDRGKGK